MTDAAGRAGERVAVRLGAYLLVLALLLGAGFALGRAAGPLGGGGTVPAAPADADDHGEDHGAGDGHRAPPQEDAR